MVLDLFSLPKEERVALRDYYFNRFVDRRGPNECWPWTGHRSPNGYGHFYKRLDKKKYSIGAHKAAWMFHYDVPVPKGLICCHSCDNPACTNALHLFIGTQKHNMQDCVNKGRYYRGKNHKSKKRENG